MTDPKARYNFEEVKGGIQLKVKRKSLGEHSNQASSEFRLSGV